MESVKLRKGFALLWAGTALFLLLSLPSFILPFDNAWAAESEAQRTAKLIEGAKKEGKLVWYANFQLPDAQKTIKKFNEKYPFIEVQFYRLGWEKLLIKITTEAQAKKNLWDVFLGAGYESIILTKKGYFAKYHSPMREFYAEGFKDPEGYWTDIYDNLNVVGYNTKLVSPKDAPKAWTDLLHPKWKGKMGMDTKAIVWFANMLKQMGEKKGLDFMRKLSEQKILFRDGRSLNALMLAAGEVSIGITLYNQRIEELKGKGASVEWVAIEPIIPEIHPLAISAHANNPNAAKLFVDFVLSREGQELMASLYRIPSRVDVEPIVPRLRKGLKILPFDFTVADDQKYEVLYRDIFLKK